MNRTTLSRRQFARLIASGAALAVVRPRLSLARERNETAATAVVRLSSNENPYGPSGKALTAMKDAFGLACRYPDRHADFLVDALAKLNDVAADQILLGDGSSEILKLCAETFTGRTEGKLIAADPTFEAILNYAKVNGAEVVKVPLTNTFGHDLPRMAAVAGAGLVYVCNPNNPTASITPKDELRDFISKTPSETMVLVDEAYYHYADGAEYESVIPMVKDHPNLIVARTFSKIYGMAGLRCGYSIAQKETTERLRSHQPWDSVNIMALAAATASLGDPEQVTNGRRANSETRAFVTQELKGLGYKTIPSQANFVMVDVRRPVVPLIEAMKQRHVQVGRLFPAMPNYMRVTIGKKSEMESFLAAFREVLAA